MLKIECHKDDVVFCHYCPENAGLNVGGYLGRVYPGGDFHGVSFDKLLVLGTGEHSVMVDERADSKPGNKPDYLYDDSAWASFCYEIGAITDMELSIRKRLAKGEKVHYFQMGSGFSRGPMVEVIEEIENADRE